MTGWKYAFQGYDKENMARAAGTYMPASFKYLREIGRFIRGKLLIRAISELNEIKAMKRPLPLTKYNKDVGHKKGIAAGRYPVKTVGTVINVLENVLANAREKGLNENRLEIIHVSSSKSVAKERKRGKIANFEVVVSEAEPDNKTLKQKKPEKKGLPEKNSVKDSEKKPEKPKTTEEKKKPVKEEKPKKKEKEIQGDAEQ
ncbi:MAG: 50S ribosomal protein L22 [Candidatus Nanoarchaeia archaeon]|nr:50S ribosomal protein L22 [Candidatus Nanoarchaeia archaeon]